MSSSSYAVPVSGATWGAGEPPPGPPAHAVVAVAARWLTTLLNGVDTYRRRRASSMRVEGRRPSGAEAGRIAGRQPASRCLDERGTPVRASRPDPSGPVAGRSPRWVPTLRILPHTPLRVHPDSAVSRSIDTLTASGDRRGRRVAPESARTTHARLVRKGEASRSDGTYRDRHRPSATARVVPGCSRIQQRSGRTEIPIVRIRIPAPSAAPPDRRPSPPASDRGRREPGRRHRRGRNPRAGGDPTQR